MLKPFQPCIFLSLFLFPGSVFSQTPFPVSQVPIKILFIANSFVHNNNLPFIENKLAEAAGIKVVIESEIELGQSINSHITNPECWSMIRSRKWDYVVIQDNQRFYYNKPPSLDSLCVSDGEVYPSKLMANNIKLQDSIKKLIPCVKIIYFAGWEKSGGIPSRFRGDNTVKLIRRIHDNYAYLNRQQGVHNVIAPIGDAFASGIIKRPYLDKVTSTKKNVCLFDRDGRHPEKAGSYLAACVLFVTLFHRSPVGLKPTYNFSGELDTFLKKTAWKAVMDNYAYTNLASITPVIKRGWLNKYALRTSGKYAAYQWYDNKNRPIKGANKRKFKPEVRSIKPSYWVETIDKKGCWYRSFPIEIK